MSYLHDLYVYLQAPLRSEIVCYRKEALHASQVLGFVLSRKLKKNCLKQI